MISLLYPWIFWASQYLRGLVVNQHRIWCSWHDQLWPVDQRRLCSELSDSRFCKGLSRDVSYFYAYTRWLFTSCLCLSSKNGTLILPDAFGRHGHKCACFKEFEAPSVDTKMSTLQVAFWKHLTCRIINEWIILFLRQQSLNRGTF